MQISESQLNEKSHFAGFFGLKGLSFSKGQCKTFLIVERIYNSFLCIHSGNNLIVAQ